MKPIRQTILCFIMMCCLGPAVAVEFEILGTNERIENNIKAYLHAKSYDCQSLSTPISQQHKEVIKLIKTAIQPFGFFNPKIQIKPGTAPDCQTVLIQTDLGQQTMITASDISIIDANDPDLIKLLQNHELEVGQPLKQLKYQRLKTQLLEMANEKLYLDAVFTENKLDVFTDENQAHVYLTFSPGPRYRISEVRTKLDKPFLQQTFIDRLIDIKPQQHVTQKQLYQLKQKLNSYGYFEQVLFKIEEQEKFDATVPLTILLKPSAKFDYSAGLGASTDAGIKASFKYNNHRVNRRGHQFNTNLQLSQLSNELAAVYKIPSGSKPTSKWFNVQLGYRDEQTDNVDSQTSKLGFSQTRIRNNRWQNINFVDVLHESFDTGVNEGESLLLVPGVSWSLTDADNITRPNRGYQLQMEFKGSSEDLLADASFAQLTFSGKFIHAIGDNNRLLYRAQLGSTASSDFDELPTTYRFFAGGDQSIRGYDFEAISPLSRSGDLSGGKHLAVGSIEFEHLFAPQWAVAVFTDFGDAFSSDFDFKQSVGAGLRWFSPIGPIRLDIGVPLKENNNDFRFHLSIGPDL